MNPQLSQETSLKACQGCGQSLQGKRRHAIYCSPRCRTSAYRERHTQTAARVSEPTRQPELLQALSLLRSLLNETRALGLDGQRVSQWCTGCTNNHPPATFLRSTCPCCCHQARQFLATVEAV